MMQGRLVLPVIALGSLLSGCTQPQGGWQHDAVHRDTFIPETHRRHVVVVANSSPETPGSSEIQKETAQIQADTARLTYQDRVFLAFSVCQHDQPDIASQEGHECALVAREVMRINADTAARSAAIMGGKD